MAYTAGTHKIAQSVSGTLFKTFYDGSSPAEHVQLVFLSPGTFINLTTSTSGELDAAIILHRITLNQTTTGSITVQDASGTDTIAVIPSGTAPCTLTYECSVPGIMITCTAAENFTVIWS